MAAPQHSPRLCDLTVRPTRLGLGLAVMVVLLWTVGLNYQVNLAYVVAFWLAGFLLVGVLLNCLQLLGLRLDITPPAEVFQGQTAEVLLHPAGSSAQRHRLLWFTVVPEDDSQTAEHNSHRAEFRARHSRPFAWPILPNGAGGCNCRRCTAAACSPSASAASNASGTGPTKAWSIPLLCRTPRRPAISPTTAVSVAPVPAAAKTSPTCSNTSPAARCSKWRGNSLPKAAACSTNTLKSLFSPPQPISSATPTTRPPPRPTVWPACFATAYSKPTATEGPA